MRGFLAGVAVTILVMAAFPAVGRWVTALPYRTFAAWSPAAATDVPTAWHGGGRGQRMVGMGSGPRAMPAGDYD